jgi:hypothetical protein
LNFSIIVVFIP